MSFNDNSYLFLDEARELLQHAEAALLRLETTNDPGLIDEVFRALHTIKGSGAMFGFETLAQFTHSVESLFDEIRKGRIAIDRAAVDLALQAVDAIGQILERPELTDAQAELQRRIKALVKPTAGTGAPRLRVWRITLRPRMDLLTRGVQLEPLFNELRELGTCRVQALTDAVPPLESIDPTSSYFSWEMTLSTDRELSAVHAVFLFIEDYADLSFEEVPPDGERDPVHTVNVEPENKQESATIRVQKEKLDRLIDLVGELVILQAILELEAKKDVTGALEPISESLVRLADDLRDATMNIRMVPLEELFSMFRRLVRDLSGQVGKELAIEIRGGSTELDKNVVDALKDPLVHIIRNAADHGIESAAVRRDRGKPAAGTIVLDARQVGSRVEITVSDDGGGLNLERIRAKAVERRLLDPAETDPGRIREMIFEPGFSTTVKTTDLSGRGVGMDVVKRNVEKLRGFVSLSSTPGQGTSVTLSIPLTLVIIEGLLVRVGETDYVITLSQVVECLDLTPDIVVGDGAMILLRELTIPILSLHQVFGRPETGSDRPRLVIVNSEGTLVALTVDAVKGRQQVVIKPLSPAVRQIRALSGATILGDGSVALILDVAELVRIKATQKV